MLLTIKTWKPNWFGHRLRSNWVLKHVIEGNIEGRIEVRGRRGRRREYLMENTKETKGNLEIETGSTICRSQSVENSVWKKLWTCRNADCIMSDE
jgi:hypothetical protein